MVIVYILMVLVGAAGAIFALQNIDPVVIRFLLWRIEGAPLAMVIILSIVIGAVLTSLVGIVQLWKSRSRSAISKGSSPRFPRAQSDNRLTSRPRERWKSRRS